MNKEKERKKTPACPKVEQAGVNADRRKKSFEQSEIRIPPKAEPSERVSERAKREPENPEMLDRWHSSGRSPKLERKVLLNLLTLQRIGFVSAEDEDLTVTKHLCTWYLVTWYFVNALCIAGSGERDSLCIKCTPLLSFEVITRS